MIVAARATNQPSDKNQALGMIQETVGNTSKAPREVSADAGYYSAQVVDGLYALGVDPFVAPDQTRHGSVVPPAPRGRIPDNLSPRDRMRRELRTKWGRQRYALRMETVEPVFGQIKRLDTIILGQAARCSEGIPTPVSANLTSTMLPTTLVETARSPSWGMASRTLAIRLMKACFIRSSSHHTRGSPGSSCRVTLTLL